jgi:uncharacterized repeat protein (TIGR01451 family)
MKMNYPKLFLFIAAIYLSLLSNFSFASHNAGGELTYIHLGGLDYQVRCVLYRDCFGIPAPTSITLNIESGSCSQSFFTNLNALPGTGLEITYPCPSAQTTCNGGMSPGFQKWEYEGVVTLTGPCPDWIFSVADCCRNSSITTLNGAAGLGLYLEARLNNQNGDNSSAQFTVAPIIIACTDQDLTFNNGMIDPDGDSLVYSLIAPRTDVNTSVIYNPGYSSSQPLTSSPQITLDAITGDFFIHPTALEGGVIVYQVLEYRNGNVVGSVIRDVQMYTVVCTNLTPTITGINGTSLNSIYVLAEQPFCFNVFCYDGDSNDSLTMISDNGIPAGVFTIQGNLRPTGVFCWTPTLADVSLQPHVFTVTVLDQNCPVQGSSVSYFSIYVTTDSTLVTPLYSHGYFSGDVYYDMNSNGIKDSTEVNVPSQMISVQPDNIDVFTNSSGEYLFYTLTNGSHVINVNSPFGWNITSDSTSYTVTDDTSYQTGFDFGLNALNPENELSAYVIPGTPRCNHASVYHIHYENTGSTMLNGRIVFIPDTAVTFSTSTPPPDQISGDSLIYNFTSLWPFSSDVINITLMLPGPGDTIHFETFAQYDSSGLLVNSDVQTLQQIVNCSCDPNDKLVFPEGLSSDHRTLYDEELQYTIRFQNTGTDTAFLVLVHDFIDASLDINTLQITGYSHPVNTTIFANRMVEFKFENILLPDSNVDELASHGYIQYKIKPLPNLLLPIVVHNEANIFFDSNFPVLTNNVWNTLVSDLSVGIATVEGTDETISVIPNPFSSTARLVLSKSFVNTETSFILMDAMGRTIVNKNVNDTEILISKGNLDAGIYFFELRNYKGNRATGKLVME